MPSRRLVACFADIRAAIALMKQWTVDAGGPEQAIYHNALVRSAIERQILVLSEAAVRLHKLDPDAASRLAPDIDWPGIRGMGNFIRHKYDDLDTQTIVDVLTNRLDQLDAAAAQAIRRVDDDA